MPPPPPRTPQDQPCVEQLGQAPTHGVTRRPPPPASTGHLAEGRLGTPPPPPQRAHLHIQARRYLPLVGALTRYGGRQQSGRL